MRIAQRMLFVLVFMSLGFSPLAAQPAAKHPVKNIDQAKPVGQSRIPVEQLQIYVDGFHNSKREASLPAEKQRQMRVTHYCQPLNDDLIQCVVYDGNTKEARLIGVEHIISDKAFQTLPDAEKKYWHPHDGEVDSGMLDLPGMPEEQKKGLLQMIRTTHGKTWHVWDAGKDKIPMGTPSLMWAIDPDKINAQTKRKMEARAKDPKF
jgi:hypothetical protein